jgi:hypothetical protein
VVDTEDKRMEQPYLFRFEMAWLTQAGFKELLRERWPYREQLGVQDYWKKVKQTVRQFCKGGI